jgi:hypothetical protein
MCIGGEVDGSEVDQWRALLTALDLPLITGR